MPKKQKLGKGSRKVGRDLIKCAKYKNENRREKNKEKRLLKYFATIKGNNPDREYKRKKDYLYRVEK